MAEQTEGSIDIEASPAQVMAVIADIEAYPQWTDGLTSVEVLSVYEDDGRPAEARFSLEAGPIQDVYDLEYDWDADQAVSWHLLTGQMLTAMDGTYELTPTGAEGTTVTYRLTVDVKMPMIGMLKRKAEKRIVDTALKGLKKRVESSGSA
jgi:ribosome-associated toxin RatA of RatAB toxin-antitoxin module